ncbi:Putative protein-S-isoprenylcysteine methyltransferase [Mycobacterium basiliense]|uniref:methanethiol S-methyltransferase n=1 Tax=Mycobacterium basiliense TaxID=2094119 RepID=A0A447GB73_9MYCO|nr:methanethiol S-methyltransferase [Mycobacterium basiliense]VDM87722.1 Putative protein-S-isoprenylcysteine methyltransferase [Mycobacterium basiliense]
MKGLLTFGYGVAGYLLGLTAFVYGICFVGNIAVPRSIDRGIAAPIGDAVVVNALLVGAFGAQHSVMARPAFKRWWTRMVPQSVERSTYVLATGLVLWLLFWQWRTLPVVIWEVTWWPGWFGLHLLFWVGWATALVSTFLINHFDLMGLRQVYLAWRGQPYTYLAFRSPLLYRLVRHPLMVGLLIAFWATPSMTAGHLLFAVAMTGYILAAVRWEERDLVAALGEQYRRYRGEVPMLCPRPRRRRATAAPGDSDIHPAADRR